MSLEVELEARIEHVHGPEEVEYAPDELVVVCLVRDGRPYLKSFIEHHFSMGVRHIVFLDNGSVDGTIEAASSYENVSVLQTDLSYKEHIFFMKRYLVERFGRGRWCLCADVDELFDYPYSDVIDLGAFLRYLSENSYTAVVAQMLDMFPERPVLQGAGREDEPLKELHRFYDTSNIMLRDYYPNAGVSNTLANDEIEIYRGGIQKTLFGNPTLLTKHPLMFVDDEIVPINGSSHWVANARVADVTCVLFHYKFIGDFYERALLAVREENHSDNSAKYKKYLGALEEDADLRIKRETARELESVDELIDDGFLVVSGEYMALVDEKERKDEASQDHRPRRLPELFSETSARARAQARRIQELDHRVQSLENSLAKQTRRAERWKGRSRDLKRQLRDIRRQLREIQSSRSFRLLGKLGSAQARVLGKNRG